MDHEYEASMEDVLHCVEQKRWYPRRAKHVRDIVSDLMARKGYAQQKTASASQEAWYAIVDDHYAKHTLPGKIRRGVFDVQVRNSTVMQELAFDKSRLIQQLQKELPDHNISDVRFRVGGF